ncbi:assimilatory sulfite reductase (NADPH) hemoprotein subunit [Paraglaciecola sp. L3A3]|uniref:assimilatory sulfite reductase (NADPH) hemoprotein subunit n=1 Tax=Paraglaciecola sp. L3A3 TaxID=2686358 RepID=UPI00131DBE57|nr:assimilatory sulfite reductase (NADPH) hemoprotein subunit [Paraglaciecola sp. L3A3]
MTTNKDPLVVKGTLSDNERLKAQSQHLRGTIKEDLDDMMTGGFNGDNFQLIRFHGMYQQDDRDLRAERAKQKLEPLQNLMLRARLPGGIITPKQWLAIDSFAGENTIYGSIRLTTRQTFQYHGVLKPKLKAMHQLLSKAGIDSIATAGDVNRNVLCTSNPVESEVHHQAYEWAKKISEHLLPKTRAYAEIWLDGDKIESVKLEEEPILGGNYLPRKFKTAVVIPPQNDVDVHANDLSFVAISENNKLTGFNVLVGGGLAMTHGDKNTYPRKASDFGFISLDKVLAVAEAVVTTQRDWGNRTERKNAKTKYTLERVGIDTFKHEVERRANTEFSASEPYEFTARGDRIGWVEGIDQKFHLTLFINSGRILDFPDKALKTGCVEIAKIHPGDFRLTANQNLIVAGVPADLKDQIETIARQHGLISEQLSVQRQDSMACVSLPTCPLAMAEAERYLPEAVTLVENMLEQNGLSDESIIFRISGCPNGCSRALLAEVGLVGKGPKRYNVYLGGNRQGTRIPKLYLENASEQLIMSTLDELINKWAIERIDKEGFGDFVVRRKIVPEVINSAKDFHL